MKLYRSPTGHWHGTKEDAEAFAKKFTTTYEVCEVPYDKKGLLAFLNEHKVGRTQYAETFPMEKLPPVEDEIPPLKVIRTVDGSTAVVHNVGTVLAPQAPHPAQKLWDRAAMEEAILVAPLDTAMSLAELIMSRMRDFVKGK